MAVLRVLSIHGGTVVLREAVADDVPAIVELLATDQLGGTRDGIASPEDLRLYLRAFSDINTDPAHALIVGEHSAHVIATMQLSFLPGLAHRGALRAQIKGVRVHGGYRSQGLGSAMLAWAIDEARRRHCAMVQLTTNKGPSDDEESACGSRFASQPVGFVSTGTPPFVTVGTPGARPSLAAAAVSRSRLDSASAFAAATSMPSDIAF